MLHWHSQTTVYQYKKIFTQKIQHQEFINKLDEFIDQHEKDEENQDEQNWHSQTTVYAPDRSCQFQYSIPVSFQT